MDHHTERHADGEDWRLPYLRRMMAAISAEVRPLLMERSGFEITSLLSSMVGSLGCSVGATWGAHGLTDEQHARVLNALRESLTNGYLAGATESDDFEIVFKEQGGRA